PMLGGISDYTGKRKMFMRFFCYLGSLSCASLFFFTDVEDVEIGLICSVLASIGWSGSMVFYNSYLPEIASGDKADKVSARGFSYGYIGSVLHMIICLSMILAPNLYGGISSGLASRISFLLVGVWWIGFGEFSISKLPIPIQHKISDSENIVLKGYKELAAVFKEIKKNKEIKGFLMAFFFYDMGVLTVMYLASLFGGKELHLPTGDLITVVLILQLVAIAGSALFSTISNKLGNVASLGTAICIWIGICLAAYLVQTATQFYVLAVFVGLVMGGIQAISRSTFSKLVPTDSHDHASYFSFYDVTDKVALLLGTLTYGLIEHVTGSMRNSSLALGIFFIIGFVLLMLIPRKKLMPAQK
ncbi:MAG: MFS transporter, partial [Cytophagales bacterium]|nr:MFS transporter [Cytophagales bacterium]